MNAAVPPGNVRYPALLKSVYTEVLRLSDRAPTTIVGPQATVFRAFDKKYFVLDPHRKVFRRDEADNALIVRDEDSDQNRYTGKSHNPSIRAQGGLYCSLQQQATVNEVAHYIEKDRATEASSASKPAPAPLPRSTVLNSKCVVKINLLGPFIAVDLSLHNTYARKFIESVGQAKSVKDALDASGKGTRSLWDAMHAPDDYSAARGIGLALATRGYRSLIVQTARLSERSPLERGDNIIFFGHQKQRISNLSVVEAYLFPLAGRGLDDPNFAPGTAYPRQIVTYPVEF